MTKALRGKWFRTLSLSFILSIFSAVLLTPSPALAEPNGARVVRYSDHDIVPIRAKVRFSTVIILPENEEILDFTTGDKEFWIINGVHNLCYVHPAQAGIRSNLNLITATGRVYSFLLTEISSESDADPDLKIFVEPKDQSSIAGRTAPLGYVKTAEAQALRKELQTVRTEAAEQVQAAQAQAVEQVKQYKSQYATKLNFNYRYDSKGARRPFMISAIYHDDAFTYIISSAPEKPTIYELKDGKPNLINFDLVGGAYIIPKIVDAGYLTIGKKKLTFERQQ